MLAGRRTEQDHFLRLLRQEFTTENILITGLRGFGKTVLLEDLRHMADAEGWLWVGNDLSESSSLSEERLALRILTDLANALSAVLAKETSSAGASAISDAVDELGPTTFEALKSKYQSTPGMPTDKLKAVLGRIGTLLVKGKMRGIVLAYDEAQCLSDHAQRDEFPMSMLVETVGALQKRDGVTSCLLVLSGLPPVFDALVATRTYTERMFHVMQLGRLSRSETATALIEPMKPLSPPLHCPPELITKVLDLCGGYPYLVQFFGRELVEAMLKNGGVISTSQFPTPEVMDRLDAGLFAARWNKTSDRQRVFLKHIATREDINNREFSAREIAAQSNGEFDSAQASQMLSALQERGLIYRVRHGRYAFTVPMSETMIRRRLHAELEVLESWTDNSPPPLANALNAPEGKKKERALTRGLWSWFN